MSRNIRESTKTYIGINTISFDQGELCVMSDFANITNVTNNT